MSCLAVRILQVAGGTISVLFAVFYSAGSSAVGERWLMGRALFFDALYDWLFYKFIVRGIARLLFPFFTTGARGRFPTYASVRRYAQQVAPYFRWRSSLGVRSPMAMVLATAFMYTVFYAVAKILPFQWLPWFQSRVMLLILYIPGIASILPLVFRDVLVRVIDTPVEARIGRAAVWWLLTTFFGFLPTLIDGARWMLDYALRYFTSRP